MRLDRLTLKAQEALQEAQHLAQRTGHPEVRALHLLRALANQKEGIVSPVLQRLGTDIVFEMVCNEDPRQNDALLAGLPDGSVVINATGMGKDRPGSPITDEGRLPRNGVAWELNYRGELDFLHQALAQEARQHLVVEDGWLYFLHGWTQAISRVLQIEIDRATFARLGQIAARIRRDG